MGELGVMVWFGGLDPLGNWEEESTMHFNANKEKRLQKSDRKQISCGSEIIC